MFVDLSHPLRVLINVLCPLKQLRDSGRIPNIVSDILKDDDAFNQLASLLSDLEAEILKTCSNQDEFVDIPENFTKVEALVIQHFESPARKETMNGIANIYYRIAEERAVFEKWFGRRLTDGNEQCPYWDSFERPPKLE